MKKSPKKSPKKATKKKSREKKLKAFPSKLRAKFPLGSWVTNEPRVGYSGIAIVAKVIGYAVFANRACLVLADGKRNERNLGAADKMFPVAFEELLP